MSSRSARQRQLRDQRDADAGGDEALDGLVVVALEGDVRLEAGGVAAAHDVARAGARAGGLDPASRAQVLQAQRRPARRARASRGSARYIGSSSSSTRDSVVPERLARAVELEQQREVELAGAQARRDLLGLALGERQLDLGVGGRGSSRSRAASASRRRSGRRPSAAGRRAGPAIAASSASAASRRARMPSAWPTQRLPGGRQADAARLALEQRHPGFGLERRDLLGDRRLRVGRAPRRRPRTSRGRRPP